jgi:hypothetical protein
MPDAGKFSGALPREGRGGTVSIASRLVAIVWWFEPLACAGIMSVALVALWLMFRRDEKNRR